MYNHSASVALDLVVGRLVWNLAIHEPLEKYIKKTISQSTNLRKNTLKNNLAIHKPQEKYIKKQSRNPPTSGKIH